MKKEISRRTFLRSASMAVAGVAWVGRLAAIKVYHIPLSDACIRPQLTKDLLPTLHKLASMGYKELEFSGGSNHNYYGFTPTEFKKRLDDTTISVPIGHVSFRQEHWLTSQNDVSDEWKKVMENALTVGQEYLISPQFDWDSTKLDEVNRGIEAYNRTGERMDQAGLRFGFNTSARELETKLDEKPVYDYLLRHMESRLVCQQLDLGMMARIGEDVVKWLRRYPHHFESLRVQDHPQTGQASLPLGEGSLPLDDILAFARKNTPTKFWVISPILTATETPWKALGNDLQRFKQYGFV